MNYVWYYNQSQSLSTFHLMHISFTLLAFKQKQLSLIGKVICNLLLLVGQRKMFWYLKWMMVCDSSKTIKNIGQNLQYKWKQ